MTDIRPISKSAFENLKWRRVTNFAFAKQDSLCPISMHELPQAIKSMATAFIKRDDGFSLVGVLGLQQNSNLYVDQQNQWINRYLPIVYRTYPFLLLPNKDVPDELVFCAEFDSGLITEGGEGEPFFTSEGKLTDFLQNVFDFLRDNRIRMDSTTKIISLIESVDLIKPWEITDKSGDQDIRVEGLYSINETALTELSDEDFLKLRHGGALPLIYCQLLSMRNLEGLQLFNQQSQDSDPENLRELDFNLGGDGGTLKFDD